jgi:hypothetical protein
VATVEQSRNLTKKLCLMAAIITLRVYGAANLPVMDNQRNTTDAYVTIDLKDAKKAGSKAGKTAGSFTTKICYG